jgi:protein gp37
MSMGDWAEGRPDERPHLERLWRLFDKTPWLDKLMLTKRPQLIRSIYPFVRRQDVWMGITAENQRWLDIRWPFLRDVEAEIHWLSIEPMFESMTLPGELGPAYARSMPRSGSTFPFQAGISDRQLGRQ